jgi:oxygen-independent coproporphyrinogen-3 oxidase
MAGLYVHVPFCRKKCPYCDFFSVAGRPELLAGYPQLLTRHLKLAARRDEWRAPFATVFFGGGTPSLLPPAAVAGVLAAAGRLFGLAPGAEVSLEANPGTVSPESLAGYRAAGVNRLSFGIQSLDAQNLRRLGRSHSLEEAVQAVAWAREAGFDNLGVDLMFALPGQTESALAEDLDRFLEPEPDHLSCYGLSVEEGTPFCHLHRAGGLELPDEERYAASFRLVHERLEAAGYRHYEIANHARPGAECRHNLGYWQRRPYLGIGAGAHSFIDRGWGERRAVPADLGSFQARLARGEDPTETLERFDRRGAMAEVLYLGLRTAAGVDEAAFRGRFGAGVAEAFPEAVRRAGARLALSAGRWRFDLEGWLLYDHLIAPFL